MADKPKDHIVTGTNADGEFICVYGMDKHKPAPLPDINYSDLVKCDAIPAGPLTMRRAPTFPIAEPELTLLECLLIGLVGALYIGWTLIKFIGAMIAVIVAAACIGFGVWYLTQ